MATPPEDPVMMEEDDSESFGDEPDEDAPDAPSLPDEDAPELPLSSDEESDDDMEEKQNWTEFIGPEGQVIAINMETKEVRQNTTLDEAAEAEEHLERMQKMQRRARRNSAIMGDAWGTTPLGRESTDVEMEYKTEAPTTVETITKQLESLKNTLKNLSDNGGELFGDETLSLLRTATSQITDVHSKLEDGSGQDNRNDVEALLDLQNVRWNFDNSFVHHYRSCSKKHPLDEWHYENWHINETKSRFPIPEDNQFAKISINLPKDIANQGLQKITIACTPKDYCFKLVQAAFKKCSSNKQMDVSDFILKVTGRNDYLLPEHHVYSYHYVRTCLRDQLELEMNLVRRPAILPPPEDEDDLPAIYRKKMSTDDGVISDTMYQEVEVGDDKKNILMSELHVPFRMNILGIDQVNASTFPRLKDFQISSVFVEAFLFNGVEIIPHSRSYTDDTALSTEPRWNRWMGGYSSHTLIDALPREVRMGFIVWGKTTGGENASRNVRLGWVLRPVVSHDGSVCTGLQDLRIWAFPKKSKKKHGGSREVNDDFIFRATTRENLSVRHPAILRVQLQTFVLPVVAPRMMQHREPNIRVVGSEINRITLDDHDEKEIQRLCSISTDVLYTLTKSDKALIWRMRHCLTRYPQLLPKFLQCVDWGNPDCKLEAHRLLYLWAPPYDLGNVLELLDAKYPDFVVRSYAVRCLRRLTDEDLQLYLLQLTQCLKFEADHDSALSRFLIERALRAPYVVGHYFFWHLKAELHEPTFAERFGVILEEYLSHCGRFSHELRKQSETLKRLEKVSAMIVQLKREEGLDDKPCMKEYEKELLKLNRKFFEPMGKFQVPLDPRWEATTLIVKKCRYMSSKMVPLWLVFKNADENGPPMYIMFKSGDDLRQDILTLQMLKIMDRIWLGEGLDMRLKPYKVIATGVNDNHEGVGMIEIVMGSNTTSGIQIDYGGTMGALKLNPLDLWVQDHNKSEAEYDRAVDNFVRSCAGYLVATYVLGIGDRHNGNIMVCKSGHLFHIDFGHFLGNFKSKFGVNRERAAFVFTPEMAFVIGGKRFRKSKRYHKFLEYCSDAYRIIRENAQILEMLFLLMVPAGMPELMIEGDIHYLRDKLFLNQSPEEADKHLKDEIDTSLSCTYRRFDNLLHTIKHG